MTLCRKTLANSLKAIVILFFFIPFAANSRSEIAVDENYIKRLDVEVGRTTQNISNAKDADFKHENVKKLLNLYNAYYHPSVRLELIRREHPEYAKKIADAMLMSDAEIQEEMDKELNRRIQNSPYINLEKITALTDMGGIKRKPICEEAASICLNQRAALNCNYVLDKCKGVVSDEVYEKLMDKYGRDDLSR